MTGKKPHWSDGILFGVLGMLGFSGTLVATRVAVFDFSPLTITSGRIVIAAALAAVTLVLTGKMRLPERRFIPGLLWMGLGLAVGFPFFLALALETVPAMHGAVVIGLAPAATAVIAYVRTRERPPIGFWFASAVGFAGVFYFAVDAGGGHISLADGWLLLALLSVGSAYVEGGRVSGALGGTTALSWAMLFLAPGASIPLIWSVQDLPVAAVSWSSLAALAYLGVISMFLAPVFWYRGLAAGGIARIGQINLLLPLVALAWSAILLGEEITTTAVVCATVVFAALIACLRSRVQSQQ
ncbi:MAG: DMT family transporter [Alphaproteobacteria bacterium]|nr:DMT family transporter [Alphaproteobacteria bacterium]